MTQPVQAIVPDTERYRSPEAETALVYPLRDHDYHTGKRNLFSTWEYALESG